MPSLGNSFSHHGFMFVLLCKLRVECLLTFALDTFLGCNEGSAQCVICVRVYERSNVHIVYLHNDDTGVYWTLF